MKILITGSNGLLGQKLVHLLVDKRIECIATSQGENRISSTEGYIYETLDITNRDQIFNSIQKHQPTVVINTAAMTNVDQCETEREACWALNVSAVNYLIEAAEQFKFHLIHLSTDFVFDGETGPYKEEDQPAPLSYYGESKYESEKLVQASPIQWSIIRTIIVYGIVEKMSRSNIVLWAKGALESGKDLTIVNDQFRAPTLAEDLAIACLLIAEKGATGIYHISGPDTMSVIELVYQVADYYGLDKSNITPISSASLNQPAKRPPRTGFVIDKARKQLGYQPRTFLEGIAILDSQLSQ